MVCGDIPYENDEAICNAEVRFRTRLTHECQDIIRRCLKVRPSDRPSLEDLLNHPWMSASLPEGSSATPVSSNKVCGNSEATSTAASTPNSLTSSGSSVISPSSSSTGVPSATSSAHASSEPMDVMDKTNSAAVAMAMTQLSKQLMWLPKKIYKRPKKIYKCFKNIFWQTKLEVCSADCELWCPQPKMTTIWVTITKLDQDDSCFFRIAKHWYTFLDDCTETRFFTTIIYIEERRKRVFLKTFV